MCENPFFFLFLLIFTLINNNIPSGSITRLTTALNAKANQTSVNASISDITTNATNINKKLDKQDYASSENGKIFKISPLERAKLTRGRADH